MNDFFEFIQMGGYAPFVWSAYGIAVVVLAANAVVVWRRKRRLIKRLTEGRRRDNHRPDCRAPQR